MSFRFTLEEAYPRTITDRSDTEKRILTERAISIEKSVHESLNRSTGNDYRASEQNILLTPDTAEISNIEIRSLFLNLKDKGNPALRNEITLGVLSADKLVNMSKDVSQCSYSPKGRGIFPTRYRPGP